MDNKKNKLDWESIEAEYRCGLKSIREIARDHGCSDKAIRKKAAQEGWARDLSAKVKAKTDDLVRTEEVRSRVRILTPTEKQKVDVSAEIRAEVVFELRKFSDRYGVILNSLFDDFDSGSWETVDKKIDAAKKLGDVVKTHTDTARKNYGIEESSISDNKQIGVEVSFV